LDTKQAATKAPRAKSKQAKKSKVLNSFDTRHHPKQTDLQSSSECQLVADLKFPKIKELESGTDKIINI